MTSISGVETAILSYASGQFFTLVRRLEAAKDLVAAVDDVVERILDRPLVGEDLLQTVTKLAANLQETAEADAAGPVAAALHRQAGDRGLTALVGRLVIEAVRLHVVEAGLGDWDVAGDRRPEEC